MGLPTVELDWRRARYALGESLHGVQVGVAAGVVITSVQLGAPQWLAISMLVLMVLLSWLIDYMIMGWSPVYDPDV